MAEAAGLQGTNRQIRIPDAPDLTDEQKDYAKDLTASMMASLITDVGDDRFTFITPGDLVAMDPNSKSIEVKGKEIKVAWTRAVEVIRLIKDPMPLDKYMDFFNRILADKGSTVSDRDLDRVYNLCKDFVGRASASDYVSDTVAKEIPKIIHGIKKAITNDPTTPDPEIAGGVVSGEYAKVEIQLNDLFEFQKKVDAMCELCEKYDLYMKALNVSGRFKDDKKARYVNKTYLDILNEMAWSCVELQGGLHAIANGLTGVYQVGMQYWETVDNPKLLAAFVEEAILTGMPGKYVVRNIYRICKANIKGDPDLDSPIMGFGRLTLIPEGDIIYKVAINRYGIRSNKNDFIVLDAVNKVNDPKLSNMFADTVTKYGNYSVNVVEKVKAGKKYEPSMPKAMQLADYINGRLKKAGVNLEIMDIKSDAFGQRDGNYVILDYGYIHRLSAGAQGAIKSAGGVTPDTDNVRLPKPDDPDVQGDAGMDASFINVPGVGKVKAKAAAG